MNTMSILSPITKDLMLIDFLPLLHLVGSVPQHFLIACSLTNSTRYRMDRQIVPSRSSCWRPSSMAGCPQGRRFVPRHRRRPLFSLNGRATQPMAAKVPVDRKCAPISASAVARAKARNGSVTSFDDGPADANLRLYNFLKSETKEPATLRWTTTFTTTRSGS